MFSKSEATPELELASQVLAASEGVQLALVFGSVARGTARPMSDLDLAVLGVKADLLGLSSAIARATGRDVQVVRLEDATIPLLEAIIDEGIVIHERQAGVAASWRSRTLAALEQDRPWYARQRDAWLMRVARQGL